MSQPVSTLAIEDLGRRYGVSTQAVTALLQALTAGRGTMAQFDIPELGGLGQWSQGGMTMVGEMFNDALKARVDGLCSELGGLLRQETSSARPGSSPSNMQKQGSESGSDDTWWGADLGAATATGSQNDIRYAYFAVNRRLAVKIGGDLTIYDTGDHEIGGISQQQSTDCSLIFVSQRGLVRLTELRVVSRKER